MSQPIPVTKAHYTLRRDVIYSAPDDGAQFIAASEARAVAKWQNSAHLKGEAIDSLLIECDRLRAEVKESKERERVAIASWDEERQRALREGGQVVELRAEVERLKGSATLFELAFQEQYARADSAEREVELRKRFSSRTAIAEHRACRAEAEVERLRAGIGECLRANAHLADGEACTLIGLKRCLHDPAAAPRQSALDATPRPSE